MKKLQQIFLTMLCILHASKVFAGFEYDPVLAPEICLEFERISNIIPNKRVDLYIEELVGEYAVDSAHVNDIKKLARAQGALKFRDVILAEYLSDASLLADSENELRFTFTGDPDIEDPYAYEEANEKKWPMLYYDDLTGRHFCSGVLIGPNHFLTAWHCIHRYRERLVEDFANSDVNEMYFPDANLYYVPQGYGPFPGNYVGDNGKLDDSDLEQFCELIEVGFDYEVKKIDLCNQEFSDPFQFAWCMSNDDPAFVSTLKDNLNSEQWAEVFRIARARQERFACKRIYPLASGGGIDLVVMELEDSPGNTYGWVDVSAIGGNPPDQRVYQVGIPYKCPSMIAVGETTGEVDLGGDPILDLFTGHTFSGSPVWDPLEGKVTYVAVQAHGGKSDMEVCFDECTPAECDIDCDYYSPYTDYEYEGECTRGVCEARWVEEVALEASLYFDQISELTLPDISLCTFQPESNYLWSKLCQYSPATTYEEIQNLKPHFMFCDLGYPPPATYQCPDPYPSYFPVADAYENNLHSGWHAASFSYKDPPEVTFAEIGLAQETSFPPPPPDFEFDEPWTIWSAGVNCFKVTKNYDEMVIDEDVGTGGEDGFAHVLVCKPPVLQALDKAGVAPINIWGEDGPSVLGHNLDYQWKPVNEIWWKHNFGSYITEISDNNDSEIYMARFVTVAEYRKENTWGVFSRPYEEEDGYFDDNTHSRTYFHQLEETWGPITDFPGYNFGGYTTGGTSKNTRYGSRAPDPFKVGLLDDSIPMLVQARSSSQSLPYEKCGYDRTSTPADGNAQGATLAFVDPQRGRVFHEICANESADGTFPRGMNPAFEVIGWQGSADVVEQFVVALYGGILADGSVSDELWLGLVQTDEDGIPTKLKWEKQTPVAGAFWPLGLRGAQLVTGYDGEGLYLFGGRSQSGAPGGLYRYRLASGLWEQIEATGAVGGLAVAGAAAVRHTNVVYVYGGVRPNGSIANGLFALYLPSGFVERIADGLPGLPGRRGASLDLSHRTSRIYLSGGFDGTNGHSDVWSLPVGKPNLGWTLESEDCQGRNCPGTFGGVLLLDRSDGSPVVAASLSEGDPSLARSWKWTRTGWMFDRELGGRDTMTDCDDDGMPEARWGEACGQGPWWSRLGQGRCDARQQSLYCDQPVSEPGGNPEIYLLPGVRDFARFGKLAAVARQQHVELVDPAGALGPQRLGFVHLPQRVRAITTYSNALYAAMRNGVVVIDATDPESLDVVAVLVTASAPTDVIVSDGRLYVIDHHGLTEFDLQDPLAPAEGAVVGLFTDCGASELLDEWCESLYTEGDDVPAEEWEEEICSLVPHRLDAYGGAVIVSADDQVIMVNASDPESMLAVSLLDMGVPVVRLRIYGSHLFVAGPDGDRIMNVSDPLDPELVATTMSTPVRSWVGGREMSGDYAASRWQGHLVFMPLFPLD